MEMELDGFILKTNVDVISEKPEEKSITKLNQ